MKVKNKYTNLNETGDLYLPGLIIAVGILLSGRDSTTILLSIVAGFSVLLLLTVIKEYPRRSGTPQVVAVIVFLFGLLSSEGNINAIAFTIICSVFVNYVLLLREK